MSGHNKFSKIKHKKGAEDAKKSKLFSGLVRQLTVESRVSRGDRNSSGLRLAIEKAVRTSDSYKRPILKDEEITETKDHPSNECTWELSSQV